MQHVFTIPFTIGKSIARFKMQGFSASADHPRLVLFSGATAGSAPETTAS